MAHSSDLANLGDEIAAIAAALSRAPEPGRRRRLGIMIASRRAQIAAIEAIEASEPTHASEGSDTAEATEGRNACSRAQGAAGAR